MFKRIMSLALMLALVLTVAPATMSVSAVDADGYTQAGTSELWYKVGAHDKLSGYAGNALYIKAVDGDGINIEGAAAAIKAATAEASTVVIDASVTAIGAGWFDGTNIGAIVVEGTESSPALTIEADAFSGMPKLREIIIARDNITWTGLDAETTVDGLLNASGASAKTGGINIFIADDDVVAAVQALDNTATLQKAGTERTVTKPYARGVFDITTEVDWKIRIGTQGSSQWVDWVFSDGTLVYDLAVENRTIANCVVLYPRAQDADAEKDWRAHNNYIKKFVIGEGMHDFNGGYNWGFSTGGSLYPNLEELVLPSTFKTFSQQDFFGANELSKINLEDTVVTEIGPNALAGTKLGIIELPATITTVDAGGLCADEVKEMQVIVNGPCPSGFSTSAFTRSGVTNPSSVTIMVKNAADLASWQTKFSGSTQVTVQRYVDPTLPKGYKYTDYFGRTEDIGATIPSTTKFITLNHLYEGAMTLVDAEGTVLDTVDPEDDVFFKFEFANCLTPNSSYKVKKGENDFISFATGPALMEVKATPEGQMLWVNSFDETKTATVALASYTDDTKEKVTEIGTVSATLTGSSFGTQPVGGAYTDAFVILDGATPVVDATKVKASAFDGNRKTVLSGKVSAGVNAAILIKNESGTDVYARAIVADENGEYAVTVDFSGMPTDKYTVLLYSEGSAYKTTIASSADASAALTALEGATSASDVAAIISTNAEALEFNLGVAEGLSEAEQREVEAKAASYLYNEIKDETSLDKEEAVEKFNQAMLMAALTTNNEDAALEYITGAAILEEEEVVAKWFLNGGEASAGAELLARAAAWRSDVVERLTGESFDDFEDFDDKLVEALVYEVIDNHASTLQVVNCLTEINEAVSISTEKDRKNVAYMSKTYITRLERDGKKYSSFDGYVQLLKDLKAYESVMYYDGGNGGNGGGIYVPSAGYTDNSTLVVEPLPTSRFSDMAGFDWANEAVTALADRGIIDGKGDGTFDPAATVKREEFAKMIVELADFDDVSDIIFDDVTESDWYYDYIRKAYAAGIINGISADEFGAGQNISRQDMAVIIYNVLKLKNPSLKAEETEFVDADSIADYAAEAVGALVKEGILNGYEDASFRPEGSATRAEAAKVIYGILNYFK